jgi:hypothetical protein
MIIYIKIRKKEQGGNLPLLSLPSVYIHEPNSFSPNLFHPHLIVTAPSKCWMAILCGRDEVRYLTAKDEKVKRE